MKGPIVTNAREIAAGNIKMRAAYFSNLIESSLHNLLLEHNKGNNPLLITSCQVKKLGGGFMDKWLEYSVQNTNLEADLSPSYNILPPQASF